MAKDPLIDAIILGCTHYPLLLPKIEANVPEGVRIVSQGHYVGTSLQEYLQRHPDMQARCSQGATVRYLTTESPDRFQETASIFLHDGPVEAQHIVLG